MHLYDVYFKPAAICRLFYLGNNRMKISPHPSPISPLFRTFANSIIPNLERANNFLYHHSQCEGQQPEEHQFADSEEQIGGHHRPVGIGQVILGVRHTLCRRPAPLCGEPEFVCAAVHGPTQQARRGEHHRPLARHRHRTESELA